LLPLLLQLYKGGWPPLLRPLQPVEPPGKRRRGAKSDQGAFKENREGERKKGRIFFLNGEEA
jgi:hypothetical protein